MDDFYRENILDHYRNPRNHGHLDAPTATAEGVNPLCGDELSVELDIAEGIVRDVRFSGRGCAISQAAASMISDVVKGKTVDEVAALGREDVLEELGIPLSPIRLKCALLSVSVLRVALGRSPGGDESELRVEIPVGPVDAIPEGGVKIVQSGSLFVGVYRIGGELYALEDRCSHDDGPAVRGRPRGLRGDLPPPRRPLRPPHRRGAVAARHRGRRCVPRHRCATARRSSRSRSATHILPRHGGAVRGDAGVSGEHLLALRGGYRPDAGQPGARPAGVAALGQRDAAPAAATTASSAATITS